MGAAGPAVGSPPNVFVYQRLDWDPTSRVIPLLPLDELQSPWAGLMLPSSQMRSGYLDFGNTWSTLSAPGWPHNQQAGGLPSGSGARMMAEQRRLLDPFLVHSSAMGVPLLGWCRVPGAGRSYHVEGSNHSHEWS